jgi:hypothetical protein
MSEPRTPTCYRLVLRGQLSERLAKGAFDGLEIEPGANETVLSGRFQDQSQLHGVLERVRDLGIELVSVNAGC